MSNSTIEEIKERLNIVDVLSSYIQVKKAGTNYKANCPFHKEKTASLMISPSKQIWHCFGCGEGGDVFGFVMKYENLDFPETLKILADKAGVKLPKYSHEKAHERQKEEHYKEVLSKINELAAKYYAKILADSSIAAPARKYLKERGLSPATIRQWQIGFAPQEYHLLEKFLLKKGFKEQELVDSGVCSRSSKGDLYDRFFNRITFPIQNYTGNIVGFTARTMDITSKSAKYINSPETLIYNKSKIIFGLYAAKQQIRSEDSAIIVEGNMDVIACHQAGFKNAVGSSGTAFTFDQLQVLSRLTKNLKFAFDTDEAGITATKRALDSALTLGFNVYIIRIENAKDPDELIKKNPQAFAKAVADAPLYMDYFFERLFANYEPAKIQQKKEITATLVPLIKKINDPLEIAHYVRLLAQRIAVPENSIYELITKSRAERTEAAQAGNAVMERAAPLVRSRAFLLEQKILGFALFNEKYFKQVKNALNAEDFKDPKMRAIFERIIERNAAPNIEALGDLAELGKMAVFMLESEYNDNPDEQAFDREFHVTLKEFKAQATKIAMSALISEMAMAEQRGDKAKVLELNSKFNNLSGELKEYSN